MGRNEGAGQLQEKQGADGQFYPIPTNLYQPDELIEKDLFLLYQGQYLLFRPKNLLWNLDDTARLEQFEVSQLYIKCQSREDHHRFLEGNLSKILNENKISSAAKANILYETSNSIVSAVFDKPQNPDNVKRSVVLVKNSIDYLKEKENFYQLMKIASSDFNEYTHALQTSAYAISLARAVGLHAFNDLSAIGIASILHDIGKVRVSKKILDKAGPLDENERREVEKHPEYGYDILHRQRSTPEKAEQIVLQHHERPNGSGYPHGLGPEILLSSRIVGLVDCFDSLTSNRSFQKKISPMKAIEMMRNDLKDDYDQNLLNAFIRVIGVKG